MSAILSLFRNSDTVSQFWPWGYKTWVHSQTQNKAQWLAACKHVSASNQSLRFILNPRPIVSLFRNSDTVSQFWPCGYKTWVHSQTQNKVQWLAACRHVSASSQSLCFILSLDQSYLYSGTVIQWVSSGLTGIYLSIDGPLDISINHC